MYTKINLCTISLYNYESMIVKWFILEECNTDLSEIASGMKMSVSASNSPTLSAVVMYLSRPAGTISSLLENITTSITLILLHPTQNWWLELDRNIPKMYSKNKKLCRDPRILVRFEARGVNPFVFGSHALVDKITQLSLQKHSLLHFCNF